MPRLNESNALLLSDIMVQIFRLNGRLLHQGDQMAAPLQINSVYWQVLGAVALEGRALSVPQIAEYMGITRQGAQKRINRMVESGLLEAHDNPRHERSPLYALTEQGRQTFIKIDALKERWTTTLTHGIATNVLEQTLSVLNDLYQRLVEIPVPIEGESKKERST